MAYSTIITTLGAAKIAAAIAGGTTVGLSHMAVGDGAGHATSPSASRASLVRETYRSTLNVLKIDPLNPNWLIAEFVVPATSGGYTCREVGLFDSVGALIAIANMPDVYKPTAAEGSSRDLGIRMVFEVTNSAALTMTTDLNVAIASRKWVSDNYSLMILLPGGTTGQILRKKSNTAGDVEWYNPASGLNILVNSVTEEQTLSASQTIINTSIVTTSNVAVYINGLRKRPSDYTITTSTRITLTSGAAASDKLLLVQNNPTADSQFLAKSNNFSEIAAAGGAAQLAARGNIGVPEQTATITAVLGILYPVGELLTTLRSGNPFTWLGFGTWSQYASGRTLVGFDSSDSDFNAVGKLGGAKVHTLTTDEIPAHAHNSAAQNLTSGQAAEHTHMINPPVTTTSLAGMHSHDSLTVQGSNADNGDPGNLVVTANSQANGAQTNTGGTTNNSGEHTHTIDIAEFESAPSPAHSHSVSVPSAATSSVGSGRAHNNLQPFTVVFFWKRTA